MVQDGSTRWLTVEISRLNRRETTWDLVSSLLVPYTMPFDSIVRSPCAKNMVHARPTGRVS